MRRKDQAREKLEVGDSSLSSQSPAFYAPIFRAILEDDWKAAETFIHEHPSCLRAAITKGQFTALHTAAAAKRTRFVKKLVRLMKPEDLELKAYDYPLTAFYYAAQTGIVTIAEEMVKKNKNLPSISPEEYGIHTLPLYAAIETGNRGMVSYLYSVTPIENLASADRIALLKATISSDLYDMAHKILNTLNLTTEEKGLHLWSPLIILAGKPSEIGSKSQPSVWQRCLNSWFKGRFCSKAIMQASAHQLVDRLWKQFAEDNFSSTVVDGHDHNGQLLQEAAKAGNIEFIIIILNSYPDLIWKIDTNEYGTLFHLAVKHRQERAFNLIYEIGDLKGTLATYHAKGQNILQLAGQLPSFDRLNIVLGAALQMQREELWFQEIENIVPKSYVNCLDENRETPRDRFERTHDELQKNGEKWMRNTANSCMLVATLIATMVFPAAFTIPGGNDQETGIPIMLLKSNWFTVFFVSDAVAMLFSSSSILIFISILTSRYTKNDFLISLPRRLGLGLATLLISIVAMLIAFSAACLLVFKSKTSTVPVSIVVAVPIVPISLFVILHHGLWFDIFRSAFYSNEFLFGSQNRIFKQIAS